MKRKNFKIADTFRSKKYGGLKIIIGTKIIFGDAQKNTKKYFFQKKCRKTLNKKNDF